MFFSPFLIPITAIIGAFLFVIIKTLTNARVRELEIKERIAMIERGLVPAPEADPRGFDHAMTRLDRRRELREHIGPDYRYRYSRGRHRRAGVTLMGVGFGLMVLIGFTGGDVGNGIGVGGFLIVIGIAFLINSLIDTQPEPPVPGPSSDNAPPSPPSPTEAPPPR